MEVWKICCIFVAQSKNMKKSFRLAAQTFVLVCSFSAFCYINFNQNVQKTVSSVEEQPAKTEASVVLLWDAELLQTIARKFTETFQLVIKN